METKIIIKREHKNLLYRFVKYHVYVDDQDIGQISNGEVKEFLISEGKHNLQLGEEWLIPKMTLRKGIGSEILYSDILKDINIKGGQILNFSCGPIETGEHKKKRAKQALFKGLSVRLGIIGALIPQNSNNTYPPSIYLKQERNN